MAYVSCGSVAMPEFDTTPSADLGVRWKKYVRLFVLQASGRGVQNPRQKVDLFLSLAGEGLLDIFDTLFPDGLAAVAGAGGDNAGGDGAGGDDGADGGAAAVDVFQTLLNALNAHFEPQVSTPHERLAFSRCDMEEHDSVLAYVTRLKKLASTCAFVNAEERIRDQVIERVRNSRLRRKFLSEGDGLTLARLLEIARIEEDTDARVKDYEGKASTSVSRVHVQDRARKPQAKATVPVSREKGQGQQNYGCCFRCGKTGHIAKAAECSARGKVCRVCGKTGHFAGTKFCKGKETVKKHSVQAVEKESRTSGDELFSVGRTLGAPKVTLALNGVNTEMIVDTGAASTLISMQTSRELQSKGVTLQDTNKTLYAYGSTRQLPLAGQMRVSMSRKGGKTITCTVYVHAGTGTSSNLLGCDTAMELGLVQLDPDVSVMNVHVEKRAVNAWKEKFPECFEGIGKLKGSQVKLHVDQSVEPVAQACRRIPFGLQEKVKRELDTLLEGDIIEEVEGKGPTPWVSPLVAVAKDGGQAVRICVDMRRANVAIGRERHPIPTAKEILYHMNGSTVFSKVDLRKGFHQLELEEDSRPITTFVTPWGLFRYKRLSLGVSSAPEIYQHTIQKVLVGLEGTFNFADDIIVGGKTKAEHDRRLDRLLQRLSEAGLTVNEQKCEMGMSSISYLGCCISGDGISVDPRKVDAVLSAKPPKTVAEVRGLMGLVNFCGEFIADLATVAEPIHRLLCKDVAFKWGKEQQCAFEEIKRRLGNRETLAFFDPQCPTRLVADASPTGLGAVLTQRQQGVWRVVAYGHRSLTSVEKRYSQTEKEALALVWACEHFRLYLLGLEFELETDHKPLQFIFNRQTSKPSPRIERWVLRLMAFTYKVVYRPGAHNIADPLSRLSQGQESEAINVAEEYVKQVASLATPKAVTWKELVDAARHCEETVTIREALVTGSWKACSSGYTAVKEELSELEGVVLRGKRIVVPMSLRERVLKSAHEGHLGIVKTKQLLRTKVWWSSMDRQAEQVVRKCLSCQRVSAPEHPEPLVSTKLPDAPWQVLSIDLMGPLPSGESLMVCVDYYSRYFEVAVLQSTTAAKVVQHCKTIFSRWGLPVALRTDNGPQFVATEFQEMLQEHGIKWLSTTPLWPQANGEVERQNRSLLKTLRIAALEKRSLAKVLQEFLLAYRSTPHPATGLSPFQAMTGREMRNKLPCLERHGGDETVQDRDAVEKLKAKEYADARRGAQQSDIQVGDKVLVPMERRDKLTPRYGPEPFQVIRKRGSDVVCEGPEGQQLRRNVSVFKRTDSFTNVDHETAMGNERPIDKEDFDIGGGGSGGLNSPEKGAAQLEPPSTPLAMSRPKRVIKAPVRFDDYVLE